jgi:hypothetical protein
VEEHGCSGRSGMEKIRLYIMVDPVKLQLPTIVILASG